MNEPIKKEVDNWNKQIFFVRKKSKWSKTQEKSLTIPGHKGNANKKHIKIPPHHC
jgi:hypothetical protein